MYYPCTDFFNQIQNKQTVRNQPNRSNDQTFMPNTKHKTVPALPTPPLVPLSCADSYSFCSSNNNPFQSNTNSNATANPCQTLYQLHTAPNLQKDLPAVSSSSPSAVNPINSFSVNTQTNSVPSDAMSKSMESFDELDHQYAPEKNLHRIYAHIINTMGEKPPDPVAYNHWHRRKTA